MTSPDTIPVKHDTLKLNGNGNHTKELTSDSLTESKDKIERPDVQDEEEEEEEEEESEGDEEDDEEPSLKYERIAGAVPDLLKKDSASALTVSNKLMVISSTTITSLRLTCAFFLSPGFGYSCRYHTYPGHHRQAYKIIQTPSRVCSRHITRCDSRLCRYCFHRRWVLSLRFLTKFLSAISDLFTFFRTGRCPFIVYT